MAQAVDPQRMAHASRFLAMDVDRHAVGPCIGMGVPRTNTGQTLRFRADLHAETGPVRMLVDSLSEIAGSQAYADDQRRCVTDGTRATTRGSCDSPVRQGCVTSRRPESRNSSGQS